LNGAILGMTKNEIKRKFDEIVDFAGVERYIDTPVKRYSSGMYVRLAFAVAAHLEPEILIVDEVLAVGDAEFQKKALGKMKDVSGKEGRTVLFVSHNMTAMKNFCESIMYLKNGEIFQIGPTDAVINKYLLDCKSNNNYCKLYDEFDNAPGNDNIRMKRFEVIPHFNSQDAIITIQTPMNVEFEFWNYTADKKLNLSLHLYNVNEECIFNVYTLSKVLPIGINKAICEIPANLLNEGTYTISMMVVADSTFPIYNFEHAVSFEVFEKRDNSMWHGKHIGIIRPKLNFEIIESAIKINS
jgi:lipopolysaccharide transport system ATP-binding protein